MRFLILCIFLLTAGCNGFGFKGGAPEAAATSSGNAWPFVPVVMRVHPFTAFATDPAPDACVLEMRIELLDRVGDVTKGVGDFRFELYSVREKASQQGEEVRLYTWDAPMTTLEQNQQHYDPITRTYSFRLKLAQAPAIGQKLRVLAQFTDTQGRRLLASAPLVYGSKTDAAAPTPIAAP